jgi:hypothetical protein
LLLPPPDELEVFLRAASPHNPGIGILDTRSGQLHLMAASMLADGDHASLAELVLGFVDIDQAAHLRGFVVGMDANSWRIVNNSGLNPVGNRMESELFDELLTTLLPLLKRPTL